MNLPWPVGKAQPAPRPITKPPVQSEPVCTACWKNITGKTCLEVPWRHPAEETTCARCGYPTVSGIRVRVNNIQGKR